MSTELKMWFGIHTKYSRVHLGVDSRKLEQCTAECDCIDVWSTDVPVDRCWLYRAAMRVLCAKPTSTAVKRSWNHFRVVFAVKRKAMMFNTLQKLVYVKMNMHMLPHDELPGQLCLDLLSAPVNHEWVSDIVEAAEEHELELAVERQATEACVTEHVSSSSDEEDVEDVVDEGAEFDGLNLF
jgi:hypothetical protein